MVFVWIFVFFLKVRIIKEFLIKVVVIISNRKLNDRIFKGFFMLWEDGFVVLWVKIDNELFVLILCLVFVEVVEVVMDMILNYNYNVFLS